MYELLTTNIGYFGHGIHQNAQKTLLTPKIFWAAQKGAAYFSEFNITSNHFYVPAETHPRLSQTREIHSPEIHSWLYSFGSRSGANRRKVLVRQEIYPRLLSLVYKLKKNLTKNGQKAIRSLWFTNRKSLARN